MHVGANMRQLSPQNMLGHMLSNGPGVGLHWQRDYSIHEARRQHTGDRGQRQTPQQIEFGVHRETSAANRESTRGRTPV